MRFARSYAVAVAVALVTATGMAAPALATSSATDPGEAQLRGQLVKLIVDYPAHDDVDFGAHSDDDHPADTHLAVRVGDTSVPISDESGHLEQVPTGAEVTLTVELPDTAVAAATPASGDGPILSETQAANAATAANGPMTVIDVLSAHSVTAPTTKVTGSAYHQVYVVIATRPGAANLAPSESTAKTLVEGAGQYWSSQTFGKVSGFTVAQTRTYTTSLTKNQICDLSSTHSIERIWREAARQSSYREGARKHLLVLTEPCNPNGALGVAEVGEGLRTGGRIVVNDPSEHTVIHEFGHNFSLGHANLESVARDWVWDYMALFSPMSATVDAAIGTVPSLDVAYQHELGVLPSGQLKTVVGSATVKLAPVSNAKGTRGALFYDPTTGQKTYLEYRSGTGFDTPSFYTNTNALSVYVSQFRYGAGVRVYTLDQDDPRTWNDTGTLAEPISRSQFRTTLRQGERLQHPLSGYTITVSQLTATQATVRLSVPKASSSLTSKNVSTRYGTQPKFTVRLGSNAPAGGTITATVNGKKVGSAKVAAKPGTRKVTVKLSRNLAVGKHKVKFKYSGNAATKSSTHTRTLTVKKATPKAKITVKNAYLKYKPSVTLALTSGRAPSGNATLYVDGKKTATKKVSKGKTTFTLKKPLSKGRHSFRVEFHASKNYNKATAKKSVTVAKKRGTISGFASGTKTIAAGKVYKDTFKVNHAAVLQTRTGSTWKTVKKLKAGTHVLKHTAKAKAKPIRYRVKIASSSTVTGKTSKTVTIKVKN